MLFRELVASLLADGREVSFTARGLSMAPFIRDGESVRLRPQGSRPRRGEVVLCRGAHDELYLHRIVRLTGATVVTRGDALAAEDRPVPFSQVLGRAVAVSGRGRLHLCFPFGLILQLRRRFFPQTFAGPQISRAARRLREIAARI